MLLDESEISRYARHLNLPGIGIDGQQKLKNASVLIVGCGGLGVPAMQYLTAAGIGKIGLVDGDVIEKSNLQRQVIYNTEEAGQKKPTIAAEKLKKLNPNVIFEVFDEYLTTHNALKVIEDYDIVIDATDNIPARYLINDACVILDKPMIYGSIYRYEGLVSVFNAVISGKRGPDYRDLYPIPPAPETVPSCEEGGVLGVLPGIIGNIQAFEAIKLITGLPGVLSGQLLLFDTLATHTRLIKVPKLKGRVEIKGLIDYHKFCNPASKEYNDINPEELNEWIKSKKKFQLVDVRESYEFEGGNIGGNSIPLSKFDKSISQLDSDSDVVFYCKKGERSLKAIAIAQKHIPTNKLYHLKGGLIEWNQRVDPDLIVI